MKINFRKLQKILDKLGLVLVVSWTDDFGDFPDNFPYQMWITRKTWYKRATGIIIKNNKIIN